MNLASHRSGPAAGVAQLGGTHSTMGGYRTNRGDFLSGDNTPAAGATGMLTIANGSQQALQMTNPASLKGKLLTLEETTKAISDELSVHKKELTIIRSERDTLQQVLKVKTDDLQSTLSNELKRLEDEMHRHFVHQKAETHRIQTQINTLKSEKVAIAHSLNGIDHRLTLIEGSIGTSSRF